MAAKLSTQSLAKLCTMRVGGEAQVYTPESIAELQAFMKSHTQEFVCTGLGSNIIFSDNLDAVVIKTYKLNTMSIKGTTIIAEAGASLPKLAQFAQKHNISGAKWLESVPGTVGGALKMNAGCFGYSFWDDVQTVTLMDTRGEITTKSAHDFIWGYRTLQGLGADELFLSCTLSIDTIDISQEALDQRYISQPIGTANCGSVFKNPPGKYAAQLIEEANLKGVRIGGAHVSTQHANFIINDANATSTDVINLISHIQTKVWQIHHIHLEPEVVIY